ncbi:hypothetical protein BZG36_02228 [Bifiguratus adelaidae]|uniref:Magnesium transport protein CorA n=1 Tax=Bifiguratus adelaidae TaxID=1938954 RepID=A0A261Y3H0_9FUNG|nr:hypothetical protein BZG36_02228 [Bifiguratus adelaidae]
MKLERKYSNVQCPCNVVITDYCSTSHMIRPAHTNATLSDCVLKLRRRPTWAKVRWINVNGISWDVVKCLAEEYEIHPLVVEDIFHIPQLDYYNDALFISLVLHTLKDTSEPHKVPNAASAMPSPIKISHYQDHHKPLTRHRSSQRLGSEDEDIQAEVAKLWRRRNTNQRIREMRNEKSYVSLQQVYLHMITQGPHADTIITFFQNSGEPVTTPLYNRIRQSYSLLRTLPDIYMLMQAVLDTIVDHAIPIADRYRSDVQEMEGKILINAKMKYTTDLHLLNGELTLLKRTLAPIQSLVNTLRSHNVLNPISPRARTYLGDVYDHITTTVEDLEIMSSITDNLVNLVFNITSYETNEHMKTLAIVTVIFLPMTWLTGVFGMNFHPFWLLENNTDALFWYLCLGCLIVLTSIFCYPYILNYAGVLHRKWKQWQGYGGGVMKRSPRRSWTR